MPPIAKVKNSSLIGHKHNENVSRAGKQPTTVHGFDCRAAHVVGPMPSSGGMILFDLQMPAKNQSNSS